MGVLLKPLVPWKAQLSCPGRAILHKGLHCINIERAFLGLNAPLPRLHHRTAYDNVSNTFMLYTGSCPPVTHAPQLAGEQAVISHSLACPLVPVTAGRQPPSSLLLRGSARVSAAVVRLKHSISSCRIPIPTKGCDVQPSVHPSRTCHHLGCTSEQQNHSGSLLLLRGYLWRATFLQYLKPCASLTSL